MLQDFLSAESIDEGEFNKYNFLVALLVSVAGTASLSDDSSGTGAVPAIEIKSALVGQALFQKNTISCHPKTFRQRKELVVLAIL